MTIRHNHLPQTMLVILRNAVTYAALVSVVEYDAPAPILEYAASMTTMTVPTTFVTQPEKPEKPEKPEESETHGSDHFNSSVTYDVQTAMVRCTLWPKTYYEWDEVWPDPPEITEAEVGAMLDNIDLDFDQSQTTSTEQKYTNCTNDIKSVNVATTAKTIDHDNRLHDPES